MFWNVIRLPKAPTLHSLVVEHDFKSGRCFDDCHAWVWRIRGESKYLSRLVQLHAPTNITAALLQPSLHTVDVVDPFVFCFVVRHCAVIQSNVHCCAAEISPRHCCPDMLEIESSV